MIRKFQIYLFCLLATGLAACSVTRHIDDGDYLLTHVHYHGVQSAELKEGLSENLGYITNKRILDVYPFYVQAWNLGKDGRDSNKIRAFLRNKVGEPPSLLDSSKLEKSKDQLKIYLFNNGYFNAEVNYSVHKKKKKAVVTYDIDLKEPYKVGKVMYRVYDRELYQLLMKDTAANRFRTGQVFNTDRMSDERDRMAQYIRNSGYFFFDKEYISFDVDSNLGKHLVNIAIEVKNPGMFKRHQVYQMDQIYVNIEYPYFIAGKDDSTYHEVDGIWIRTNGMKITKELFPDFIHLRPGMTYSDQAVLNTYNRLYSLQIFGTVRIEMEPDSNQNLINCYINLIPDPSMKLAVEPQVITSDQSSSVASSNQRIWGLSGQILFRNKNLFHGAELLDLTYSGSAEFQYSSNKFYLSNLQQSVNTSLNIPKHIWVEKNDWVKRRSLKKNWQTPITSFSLTFSYLLNRDFVQRTSLLNMAYSWNTGFNRFRVIPVELNLNQVQIKSNYLDNLSPGDRVLLSSLLNPNFIPSNRVEWYYMDQGLAKTGNYHQFRLTVEQAGLLFHTGFIASGTPRPADGIYKVFNTNLFQYLKTDFDLRYYTNPKKDVKFAYRMHTGVALPYGNSSVIPFDKRFFLGGANSLRGWLPRSVGPGTYNSTSANQIDRSGEIVIEGSAELRFRVINHFLEGALFVDAGNIWNVRKDSSLQGAQFSLLFWDQLAMNTGIGARFDFDFFLVRLDLGLQLRDPSYHSFGGWVVNDFNYLGRRANLNFGIGYPF
ncbi:MAG: BamA/TamA family outer membrane protein [Bacteroidetes bacterium]|nr:BamA/TamA family outer membrane protein [Bacteroidota bacterium]